MHGNRALAVLAFLGGAVVTVLTSIIIHDSGVMSAASDIGRQRLGWAAIVVHVIGVVGFGLFAGWFIRQRQRLAALGCILMMLAAATYSAWQVASFAAAETLSVSAAQDRADKAAAERRAAEVALAKQRQDANAELVKQQLKIIQGEMKGKGRTSRKDAMDAGNKLVADVVGSGPVVVTAAPEAPKAVPVETAKLATIVTRWLGWEPAVLQASPNLLLAVLLIVIEIPLWPLAAYFWRRPPVLAVMPAPKPRTALEADPPRAATITPPEGQKALPAPQAAVTPASEERVQPEPDPDPPTPARILPSQVTAPAQQPRQPISEAAREALIAAGFPLVRPVTDSPKLDPRRAAERFALWLRAMGLHGEHNADQLAKLYRECCEIERRLPVAYNSLASNLERLRGVNKRTIRTEEGAPTIWTITAERKYQPQFQAKPERKALGNGAPEPDNKPDRSPTGAPSKVAEMLADRVPVEADKQADMPAEEGRAPRRPFGVAPVLSVALAGLSKPPDGLDLAWLRQQRKEARRVRIVTNLKQRGPRRAA